jgi:transcription antitermination factor NusG
LSAIYEQSALRNLAAEASELGWFAVYTRSNFEKKVAFQLQEKYIQVFLPLLSRKHKWSDRQRLIDEPLFRGYVFVRIPMTQEVRVAVLSTMGVIRFVGAGSLGTPIPSSEIHALRTMLAERIPLQLRSYLEIGQRVRIRGGCLDGIEGILTAVNGDESLVVSVQSIQKSVAMRISGFAIEPVRPFGRSLELERKCVALAPRALAAG